MQADVIGKRAGACVVPVSASVEGEGFFFRLRDDGTASATVPLLIKGSFTRKGTGGMQTEYIADVLGGGKVRIIRQEGLEAPVLAGPGRLVVPAEYQWSSLSQATATALESSEGAAEAKEAAAVQSSIVVIRGGGPDCFSVDGPPVHALPAADRTFLDAPRAHFLLAALGLGDSARHAALEASAPGKKPVPVPAPAKVSLPKKTKTQTAPAPTEKVAKLRAFLLKEATVIPDQTAVDTVLSLGFLNDENIFELVGHLPELDEAIEKLCELLLAARIGLKQIPEAALERAIRSTEPVRDALRLLAFRRP